MIIGIASDHAGFSLKQKTIQRLELHGHKVYDLGPNSEDSVDYPDYADLLCSWYRNEIKKVPTFGVLICGSGQGMVMRANKYSEIRAALCWNLESSQLARQHNDANVLCLGSRLVEESLNLQIVDLFLNTSFSGGRHEGRVTKITGEITKKI
jgi:ribose 5-phosphate isomerase B